MLGLFQRAAERMLSPTRVQPKLMVDHLEMKSTCLLYLPSSSIQATRKVSASESQKPLALPNGEAGFEVPEGPC